MKIALIGYGKMGKMIEQIAISRGHEIVSIIDIDNQQDFDSPEFASADVAIEFTSPTAAYGNYLRAWKAGVKVVSGSTGGKTDHEADVRRMGSDEGKTLFWASNFSIGVAIFSAVNRYLAKIMNGFPQYDVRMEETHHIHKLDAPSGTAITLAEEIVDDLDRKTRENYLKMSLEQLKKLSGMIEQILSMSMNRQKTFTLHKEISRGDSSRRTYDIRHWRLPARHDEREVDICK